MRRAALLSIAYASLLLAAPFLADATDATDAAALAALLPAAPAGWSATDGQVVDQRAAGTEVASVSRVYRSEDGATVELTYIGSPAVVMAAQGAATMFGNPAMVKQMNAANPQKQFGVIDVEGWSGWRVVDREDGESEATAFNQQLVVKIELDRGDADVLGSFVELVPWDSLAALQR